MSATLCINLTLTLIKFEKWFKIPFLFRFRNVRGVQIPAEVDMRQELERMFDPAKADLQFSLRKVDLTDADVLYSVTLLVT